LTINAIYHNKIKILPATAKVGIFFSLKIFFKKPLKNKGFLKTM